MFGKPTAIFGTTLGLGLALTATLTGALSGPLTSPAQAKQPSWQRAEGRVVIVNNTGEDRKICFFRKAKIHVVPMHCHTFRKGNVHYWDNTRREEFRFVTYRPRRGIDKKLRTQTMPADASRIRIASDDSFKVDRFVPPPPAPNEGQYYVNFCNVSQPGDVWLHIGGLPDTGRAFAQGYFRIKPGDCTRVNFSQAAQRIARVPLGTRIRPLYRAFAVDENGAISRVWRGSAEDGDPLLCVNTAKSYKMRQSVDANLQTTNRCDRENQAKRLFLKGPKLKVGQNVGIGRVSF